MPLPVVLFAHHHKRQEPPILLQCLDGQCTLGKFGIIKIIIEIIQNNLAWIIHKEPEIMRIFSRKRKHFRWADKNMKNVRKKLSIYGQGICMNHGIVCLAYIQISLCCFQRIRNTLLIRRIRLIQILEIYLIQGR